MTPRSKRPTPDELTPKRADTVCEDEHRQVIYLWDHHRRRTAPKPISATEACV